MSFDLQIAGKRALVTGGGRGVGAALVEKLVEEGAQVVAVARSYPNQAIRNAHYITADVSTPEGAKQTVDSVQQRLGGIDILVNVVGGSTAPAGGFACLDDEEWLKELNLNLMSAVRLDRALLPTMIEQQSGVVIHVTSIQRILPLPDATIGYAAAKAALSAYSKALSKEVTPKGNPCRARFPRLDRDGSRCRTSGAVSSTGEHGSRRSQANRHAGIGRDSIGSSSQAY